MKGPWNRQTKFSLQSQFVDNIIEPKYQAATINTLGKKYIPNCVTHVTGHVCDIIMYVFSLKVWVAAI